MTSTEFRQLAGSAQALHDAACELMSCFGTTEVGAHVAVVAERVRWTALHIEGVLRSSDYGRRHGLGGGR